jgi:hypothetical protein
VSGEVEAIDQMALEAELREAIEGRIEIVIEYGRDPKGANRRCQPHVLYRDQSRHLILEVFQVAGYSSSGGLPGWKHLRLDAIHHVVLTGTRFLPAPGYNPQHEEFAQVLVWVDPLR